MARALTNDFITQATARSNRPIFFFEGEFVSYTMNLWSGFGDLSWNSKTWLGNGWFQGVEGIEETDNIGNTGMTIILAGVPLAIISTILNYSKQGAPGKLWLGFLDSDGDVVSDPYLMFKGRLDVPTVDDRVEGPVITIAYESRLVDIEKTNEFRYNSESQKIFNPNDKGFDYVPSIQDWTGQWGPKKKTPPRRPRNTGAKSK